MGLDIFKRNIHSYACLLSYRMKLCCSSWFHQTALMCCISTLIFTMSVSHQEHVNIKQNVPVRTLVFTNAKRSEKHIKINVTPQNRYKFDLCRPFPLGWECYRESNIQRKSGRSVKGYITTALTKETSRCLKRQTVIINANVQGCWNYHPLTERGFYKDNHIVRQESMT